LTADFSYDVNSLLTTFTNQSIGSITYLWDFGDGTTSTDENPQHQYVTPGTYDVTLTASNDCSSTITTQTIEVTPPFYFIAGNVFIDNNENCNWDAGTEDSLSDWIVSFDSNGQTFYTNSDSSGNYAILLVDTGEYIVNVIPPNAFWIPCSPDSTITIDVLSQVTVYHIGVEPLAPCPLLSVEGASSPLLPCMSGKIKFQYGSTKLETASLLMLEMWLLVNVTS